MSADVSDGDLARLARGGDPVAFRLLVERHQPMVRARARQLGPDPGDVDDIVQESFLQAFLALDRLRDPDRFAGWLAGIVLNVCRSLHRRAPVTLLRRLARAAAPDIGRRPALGRGPGPGRRAARGRGRPARRAAARRHPALLRRRARRPGRRGARRGPGQPAQGPAPAARLPHRAPPRPRSRLREDAHDHRPRRAHRAPHPARPRAGPRSRPTSSCSPTTPGRRDLPIWLLGRDSHRFADDARPGPSPDELTDRLLRAAGARVTAVDVDELGPEVTVARIELATPAGPEHVTARLLDGLAVAIISGAPIRVADAVMDRLAVPAGAGQGGPMPEQTARDLSIDLRPRYEPRNLTFAAGLDHWVLGGSFTENTLQSHWQDYSAAADHGTAVLSAAVPQPEGFAWLAQEIFADDYRGAAVTFRGQFRTPEGTGLAGLFLRVMTAAATSTGPSPRRPPWPTRPTTSSPSKVPATGPPTRSPRRSRTTPTPSRSASSWPAPAGSSCATRSSPGLGCLISYLNGCAAMAAK